ITAADFDQTQYALPLILGQDTIGKNVTVDLARMPHLLIAGSTGSGKSVALNTMLMSLLCCRTPAQLKLILVDPKRLEFASYEDLPHLLFPITAEPRMVINILKWVVQEMEQRYVLLAAAGVKHMADYQLYCPAHQLPPLPYLAIVIDELADLMMTAGKEVENLIIRIAQKARAAGIHMIVATQRPSVDVITGLIKINFPSRISFRVASKVDSRTILDSMGAEKLLGRGDMLFLDAQAVGLRRVHGAYVTNAEVQQIVTQILQVEQAHYLDLHQALLPTDLSAPDTDGTEALLPEILAFLRKTDEISISLLQRRFRIGYNRSARIIDTLATLGYLYQAEAGKPRRVNKGMLGS
ncbi:MAG TPA: DNA translocase FtsK, partial [Candidatus Babeliales bacterium]|nr:DNA translocase FtsK [Candidatus Babeliales bacterium]